MHRIVQLLHHGSLIIFKLLNELIIVLSHLARIILLLLVGMLYPRYENPLLLLLHHTVVTLLNLGRLNLLPLLCYLDLSLLFEGLRHHFPLC